MKSNYYFDQLVNKDYMRDAIIKHLYCYYALYLLW